MKKENKTGPKKFLRNTMMGSKGKMFMIVKKCASEKTLSSSNKAGKKANSFPAAETKG